MVGRCARIGAAGDVNDAARTEMPEAPHRIARSLSGLIVSVAPLNRVAARLTDVVSTASESSWVLRRLLAPVHRRMAGEVTAAELLVILDAIRSSGVDFWLAGGWGVDALVGRQTRRHGDVDVVIGDFERDAPAAAAALESLGFSTLSRLHQDAWMPDSWQVRDRLLRSVGLSSIDWPRLRAGLDLDGLAADRCEASRERRDVFTEGHVAGHPVPCLSAKVQLLFHSGYELRLVHHHDVALLRSMIASEPTPR